MPDLTTTQISLVTERLSPGFTKHHLNWHGTNPDLPVPGYVFHEITAPDPGPPHDHPFDIEVFVLRGAYVEETYTHRREQWHRRAKYRVTGEHFCIPSNRIHRIISVAPGGCLTLALYGPAKREVRFWPEALEG